MKDDYRVGGLVQLCKEMYRDKKAKVWYHSCQVMWQRTRCGSTGLIGNGVLGVVLTSLAMNVIR